MTTGLCIYVASALLSLIVTPAVIRLARRIDALDQPGARAVHTRPVPRIGGVAIFFSAACPMIVLLFLHGRVGAAFGGMESSLAAALVTAVFVFLLGLVDDLRGLPARVKLLAEILAAAALCAAGVRITALDLTETFTWHLGWLSYPLTILWIAGVTNAVNLSDGLDGLAAGVSAIACGAVAVFAGYSGDFLLAVLMLALLGSLSGFLFYNFNPAKVFMGDCGSLFLGFTIASAGVICAAKSSALAGLTLPAVALGIPICDTFFAILRRSLEGRSIFSPDREHFHHRLIALGLTQRHAVIAIYGATGVSAGLGLFMMVRQDAGSLILFGGLLFLVLLLFHAVGAVPRTGGWRRSRERHAAIRRHEREDRVLNDLQRRFRRADNLPQWWQAVCEAARRLDFAWMSLRVRHPDGSVDTTVWRGPSVPATISRVITLNLPLTDEGGLNRIEFEVGVLVDGSLESAGRRAALFSRLIDERRVARPDARRTGETKTGSSGRAVRSIDPVGRQ